MGEQKLQNSLNFSAGESQNKAQMRRAELSTRRRRERERESAGMEEGGNAVVGISALVEFLIGWERSGKLGLLDTFNLVWIIDQNRPKSPTV